MSEEPAEQFPLVTAPRQPVRVVSSQPAWHDAIDSLGEGTGPLAVDVERASGFRYSQRAYLVQVYRRGSANFLVDPLEVPDLSDLTHHFAGEEWVFHAASQDLPSLRELGVEPVSIFDTELGARIAGLPRVGLQGVVEDLLGISLKKAHSAADWSTRPLPDEWLDYAALDVELLPDLREGIHTLLEKSNKLDLAREEFDAVLTFVPPERPAEPWRRLSGLHQVRGARAMAVARELWLAREEYAKDSDTAPGRLIPDRSIIAVAMEKPDTKGGLAGLKSFQGRASRKELDRWWRAVERGLTTEDLPALRGPSTSLPPPRAWIDKAPDAHRRYVIAKDMITRVAESLTIPVENVLTPDHLRRVCWAPDDEASPNALDSQLQVLGARRWQRDIVVPLLIEAFSEARQAGAVPETT
jgi:ribonuclease D